MKPDHYLVFDLEATCDDQGRIPRIESETIEFGAVMADAETLQPVDEKQIFVKPVRHPKLTPFCTELTSITQSVVDAADEFPEALASFLSWTSDYGRLVWCSWGEYDRRQILRDCELHGVENPIAEHRDLKGLFTEKMNFKKQKGLRRAFKIVGLELEGTHHCGLDDARNTVRLLPYTIGSGAN